jgi:hypothetical protein
MNPIMEWRIIGGQRFLTLCFYGRFTSESADHSISSLSPLIDAHEGKVTMIWECTKMIGYDLSARDAWQAFMKKFKSKIETVHLVSNNYLIRTGAMVIGAFTGIKICTWEHLDDLLQQELSYGD